MDFVSVANVHFYVWFSSCRVLILSDFCPVGLALSSCWCRICSSRLASSLKSAILSGTRIQKMQKQPWETGQWRWNWIRHACQFGKMRDIPWCAATMFAAWETDLRFCCIQPPCFEFFEAPLSDLDSSIVKQCSETIDLSPTWSFLIPESFDDDYATCKHLILGLHIHIICVYIYIYIWESPQTLTILDKF